MQRFQPPLLKVPLSSLEETDLENDWFSKIAVDSKPVEGDKWVFKHDLYVGEGDWTSGDDEDQDQERAVEIDAEKDDATDSSDLAGLSASADIK